MTAPTKSIAPILLEDMRRIYANKKEEAFMFSTENITECFKRVTTIELNDVVHVDKDLTIRTYYAGHVLGAVMFHIQVGDQSLVYTGDYNMTSDRHLGAAWIERCRPDVLITESTYATTVRDSKKARERDFLKKVHSCVMNGGKVLIPVFALGRAQELCILIETFWEKMRLKKIPVYFQGGITGQAMDIYKQFPSWMNEKIRTNADDDRNLFDFKYIKPFDMSIVSEPGAMVLFASPGMLYTLSNGN